MMKIKKFIPIMLLAIVSTSHAASTPSAIDRLTIELVRVLMDAELRLNAADALVDEVSRATNQKRVALLKSDGNVLANLEASLSSLDVLELRASNIVNEQSRIYFIKSIRGYRTLLNDPLSTLLQMKPLLQAEKYREAGKLSSRYRNQERHSKGRYLTADLDLAYSRYEAGKGFSVLVNPNVGHDINPFQIANFSQGLELQRHKFNDKSYFIIARFFSDGSEYILELNRVIKSLQWRKALTEKQLRLSLDTVTNLNLGWSYDDYKKLGESVIQLSSMYQDPGLVKVLSAQSEKLAILFK